MLVDVVCRECSGLRLLLLLLLNSAECLLCIDMATVWPDSAVRMIGDNLGGGEMTKTRR